MARIFDEIGVYGYSLDNETRILAGLLTGDPQLLIGRHGAAKSMLAEEIANALYFDAPKVPFVPYDSSKVSFEDILGFPNPKKMQEGEMAFVNGPVTIWDKEFVFLDEINRAESDMQSKLLDLVRSRRIMGYPTVVKYLWAAMNPKGYEGTNDLDEALVGRFANFVYVPDVLDLSDGLRAKVAARVSRDDSPALKYWLNVNVPQKDREITTKINYEKVGTTIRKILGVAATQYQLLGKEAREKEWDSLSMWVSFFANTLKNQTKPTDKNDDSAILLDGRRLGLIRRQIMAVRAVQLARANLLMEDLPDLKYAAEIAVKGAIPTGVNAEGGNDATALAAIDKAFKTLEGEFDSQKDDKMFKTIVRLTTSSDLVERVQILLEEPLDDLIKNSAWSDMCRQESGLDMSVLCLLAEMVECRHKGTIPKNVLSQLSAHIDDAVLAPSVAPLQDVHMDHAKKLSDAVEQYQGTSKVPQRLMAIAQVNKFIQETTETRQSIIASSVVEQLTKKIQHDCDRLTILLEKGSI